MYSKVWSAMYENQKLKKNVCISMYIKYWVKPGQYVQYSK